MAKRSVAVVGLILLATLVGTGSVGAQTESPPPDEELAQEFQDEMQALLDELGADGDPATLLGDAGDLDLPPGDLVFVSVATTQTPVVESDASSLAGPCTGMAVSFDGDGNVIDAASDFDPKAPPYDLVDGGQAFTASNPFEVDVNGYVVYAGQATPAPLDHTWAIQVQGLSLDSGGDDNADAEDRNAGTVNLSEDLPTPAKVNALFHIDGELTAADGFSCNGDGFIKTVGGAPLLMALGLILLLCGGLGALFNARPAKTWQG